MTIKQPATRDMEQPALTPTIEIEPWSLSKAIAFWRTATGKCKSLRWARKGFALDNERTARDIGLSIVKIRFGDLTRGSGSDAELGSR
jgi:hypothetical protein